MATEQPLVVITGPTASGKTGLALELAERFDGEIICADSRTVYKGMDIGTAKPTRREQRRVPHHLLDIVEPGEPFSAADFQRLARQAIHDIRSRGKVAFMVGGTGLYIDSVVLNYNMKTIHNDNEARRTLRQSLQTKSINELQQMIKKQHLALPNNIQNRRHLEGVLLRGNTIPKRDAKPDASTIVVAITTEKSILLERIARRAQQMFADGVVEEAVKLARTYGWDNEAMTGNIYPILRQVVDGTLSQSEAVERFIIRDRQLAKRQLTWLKRHSFVQWLSLDEARVYIEQRLASR